jgi:hypothetical protein
VTAHYRGRIDALALRDLVQDGGETFSKMLDRSIVWV